MKTYLVAFYGGIIPTFFYAETLKEARSHALILLSSQHCNRNDVLSVVDIANDSIVYYGKRDKLINSFNSIDYKVTPAEPGYFLSIRPVLNWISTNVSRLTIG